MISANTFNYTRYSERYVDDRNLKGLLAPTL